MATEINKDITTVDEGIIIHQVNCQNRMGSGVARSLYLKYPIIKELYHKSFNRFSKEFLFGKIHFLTINKNLYIGNSYTQFDVGNLASQGVCYTDHEKLKHNILKSLNLAKEKGLKLYLPKYIGCGLAGGDWSEISQFIYEIDRDNNILICTIE